MHIRALNSTRVKSFPDYMDYVGHFRPTIVGEAWADSAAADAYVVVVVAAAAVDQEVHLIECPFLAFAEVDHNHLADQLES